MEYLASAEWQKLNLARLAVALGLTSLIENIVYHPWWVLKTREQVQFVSSTNNVWMNSYRLASDILKHEGPRALYRGFWPGTLGTLPSGYLYLIVYHKTKHELSQPNVPSSVRLAAPFISGIAAEAASIGLFVPIDVVTQRMQLQNSAGQNSFQVAKDVVKSEGYYGMYRGTALTAFKLGLGSGIWWLCYERLKPMIGSVVGDGHGAGVTAGFVGGVVSTFITNPLDVVKTRIQTQVLSSNGIGSPYTSMVDGVRNIWIKEGWGGLNRGLAPKLISQGPLSAIWAVVYEAVMRFSVMG